MNTLLSRHASVRPAVLAALFAALLAALLALGAPAQAHDTLLESDPADGATLETSPEAITLTFSADILEVSPLVRITDESGEQLAEITPSVDGPVATATLEEPLPAGTSTVQWRVVSSDGHPIEGTFEVTVEQDAAAEETTEAPAEESAPAETTAPAEQGEEATAEAAEEESGSSMTPLLIVLGVVVVGAVGAVLLIMRRRD
ncbi:copper resistance CopC family protein [Brachybacterium sp. sponge]|uniref:copper resistance CopC family protein n=1 Tax=Brachybacterium sp. sponge TaxID=1775432 RepID=UPI0007A3E0AE|nr:copper resistance CopC family protein [Brachybacterium sp. sponge]